MEKKLRLGDLYAFYGALLTDKRRDILEAYCNEDLSITEISDNYGVSRQSVYDVIKRSEGQLEDLENKLGLFDKFARRERMISDALVLLEGIARNPITESRLSGGTSDGSLGGSSSRSLEGTDVQQVVSRVIGQLKQITENDGDLE